jgi:hypothetical protein
MERGGGVLEASGGGADLGEAVLEEVELQIRLLLEPLELLHAQLVQLDPSRACHGYRLCSLGLSRRRQGRSGSGCKRGGRSRERRGRRVAGSID